MDGLTSSVRFDRTALRLLRALGISAILAVGLFTAAQPLKAKGEGYPVWCWMRAENTSTNHQVQVFVIMGFEDWLRNPTNVEIDWDDGGPLETFYVYDPDLDFSRLHTYPNGGMRHIKVSTEDVDGSWCEYDGSKPAQFDVLVN
jgi:hypothetical protein